MSNSQEKKKGVVREFLRVLEEIGSEPYRLNATVERPVVWQFSLSVSNR